MIIIIDRLHKLQISRSARDQKPLAKATASLFVILLEPSRISLYLSFYYSN